MLDLIGKTTPDGWLISEQAAFPADQTGGYFSSCFYVIKDGKRAFLKALDIEKFDFSELPTLIAGFQYETDLLALCKDKRLNRIVQIQESGRIERNPTLPQILRHVPFLVFELAEGDIRRSVDVSTSATTQWRFFVLHQTTLALMQLHAQSIAHQDLKPSNVLHFGADSLKLGDLGRSSLRGKAAPHDNAVPVGALNYAPFEQRYGHRPADWTERRLSADVFHLGCLVVFAFTNVVFPDYVMNQLDSPYHPQHWGGRYEEVMPFIQASMAKSLYEVAQDFPELYRSELTKMVLDLCHPDPTLRGRGAANGKTTPGDLLWLQRYVSRFDILEKSTRVRRRENNA
jgi:serine/threonine protein kinase